MNIKTIKGTFLIIICIIIVNQISVAQVIKKYNGTYNTNVSFNGDNYNNSVGGIASYSYYDHKDFERIYHGPFLYENKYNKLKINGNFKNNKKDGYWLYCENKDNSIITVKGKYINGVLQGLWVYQEKNKRTNKVLKESIVTFKDGMLVGKYYFNVDYKVVGSFDTLGRGIGEWIITHKLSFPNEEDKIEIRRKYRNDSLIWKLKRNLSNGEKMDDYTNYDIEDNGSDYNGNKKESQYYFYLWGSNGRDALEFWLEPTRHAEDMGDKCPIFEYIIKGSDFISYEERESILKLKQ